MRRTDDAGFDDRHLAEGLLSSWHSIWLHRDHDVAGARGTPPDARHGTLHGCAARAGPRRVATAAQARAGRASCTPSARRGVLVIEVFRVPRTAATTGARAPALDYANIH